MRQGQSMRSRDASNATLITTGLNAKKSRRSLLCRRCAQAGSSRRGAVLRRLGSAIHSSHHACGITVTGCGAVRSNFVDAAQIVGRELYLQRADILFEIAATLGAGDGDDVVSLREKPGES